MIVISYVCEHCGTESQACEKQDSFCIGINVEKIEKLVLDTSNNLLGKMSLQQLSTYKKDIYDQKELYLEECRKTKIATFCDKECFISFIKNNMGKDGKFVFNEQQKKELYEKYDSTLADSVSKTTQSSTFGAYICKP